MGNPVGTEAWNCPRTGLSLCFSMLMVGLYTLVLARQVALRLRTALLVARMRARALTMVEIKLLRPHLAETPLSAALVRTLIRTIWIRLLPPSSRVLPLETRKGPLRGGRTKECFRIRTIVIPFPGALPMMSLRFGAFLGQPIGCSMCGLAPSYGVSLIRL